MLRIRGTATVGAILFVALFNLSLYGAIIWAAVHFIRKLW